MFLEQLACFASSFLGVLQASFYCVATLGRNMQDARHDLTQNREDSEEKHETQNHLSQAWP
jgi:hypothetical protein